MTLKAALKVLDIHRHTGRPIRLRAYDGWSLLWALPPAPTHEQPPEPEQPAAAEERAE